MPAPHLLGRDALWGCIWGKGQRLKVRTRALYGLPVTRVPLFLDFQTPGCGSACQAWLGIQDRSPLSNPNQVPLSSCLQSRSRPGWGWEAGCQGKYEAS